MIFRRLHVGRSWCVLAIFAAACSGTSSTAPSASSGSSTGSVAAPRPVAPATNALVHNQSQPITLVVQNAVVTKPGDTTYTFEVATDAAFASKVQTKDGVAEGSNGQTQVTLDLLAPAKDYYWHARAQGAGTTGVFGATFKFTVGPAVVLNAPTAVSPINGATTSGWPTFTVINAPKSGPAGPVVYRFEVATTAAFTTIVLTGTVAEGVDRTSYTPPASQPAPAQTSLFWRATAIDQTNAVTSPASAPQSFTFSATSQAGVIAQQMGVVLWPGVQPTGSVGKATMGPGWDIQMLRSFDGVIFQSPPLEVLQVFDLLDRGFDPNGAIGWMKTNGYPTTAVYYPDVKAIGFPYQYMALIGSAWELVLRAGA